MFWKYNCEQIIEDDNIITSRWVEGGFAGNRWIEDVKASRFFWRLSMLVMDQHINYVTPNVKLLITPIASLCA